MIDATRSLRYYLSLGVDGIINRLCYQHDVVRAELGGMLDSPINVLDASHAELAAAAARYRRTDQQSAAAIDGSYPAATRSG